VDDQLRASALAVSSAEGEKVYEQLLAALAAILGVEYALISVYVEPGRRTLRTLASHFGGRIARNFEYPIDGTPCEGVMGRAFGIYASGVRDRFPRDAVLREQKIEGYAAATLNDAQGGPIGLLAVMSRAPLDNEPQVEAIMKIFATRIATEIERRRAEEVLRASEEQYRAIFNATDEPVVLRDAGFRIVDVNRAYETMSGYSRAEVVGSDSLTFSAPGRRDERIALHRRALAGEQVRFEAEGRTKDGQQRLIEVRLVPIQYRGQPHVLQIGQDVTARRKAEVERAQLEAQLRQAQKMEAIGQLAGGIAHDFNNILQGILGNLTLAAERQAALADARLGKYLERAQHSAQRARELIGQMLTFSRGQRGAPRPVSLPELVRDACKLLRSTLPATVELRQSLDDELPALTLDPVQVEQVVLNLCINARDAMNGAGAIRIGVRRPTRIQGVCASCRQKVDGRYAELFVRDTGPGIAPQVMDRMFEPFFSTKAVGRGSGMGLSLAHGIVHEHRGHILVDSLLNERTKFRVLFEAPGSGAPDGVPAGDGAQAAERPRVRLAGRVLVVDDEQAIREFMADLLGGWGLEVEALPDGAAARDAVAADTQRYDLVITDQTMPQLTGIALARELARLRPGLPVILYTGYAEDLSPQELRDAGVVQLVRKPIEPSQFFPLLAAHLTAR
jgi:PAS domain S-box-containing protein